MHHHIVRDWANYSLDLLLNDDESDIDKVNANDTTSELVQQYMTELFLDEEDNNGVKHTLPARITINSKTGEAFGVFGYWNHDDNQKDETAQESVQDMCISNHLFIRDKNYPDADGNIVKWQDTNDTTRAYSHRLYHDFAMPLRNVHIEY